MDTWYIVSMGFGGVSVALLLVTGESGSDCKRFAYVLGLPVVMGLLAAAMPTVLNVQSDLKQIEDPLKFAATAVLLFMAVKGFRMTSQPPR